MYNPSGTLYCSLYKSLQFSTRTLITSWEEKKKKKDDVINYFGALQYSLLQHPFLLRD